MSSRQIKYVPQKNVPSVLFSIRITTALGTFFRGTDVNSRFLRLILKYIIFKINLGEISHTYAKIPILTR